MPEFKPEESKTAVVAMTNPTGSPFDYSVTLYLGVNMVAMASASFHLEGNETKNVEISPVVMPRNLGTYPVYLDVWSNSSLLGHYKAVEDVVIAGGATIESLSIPSPGYEGAVGLFEAVCYVPSPTSIKVFIRKEDLPSGCDEDLTLLSADFAAGDLISPNNLYSLSNMMSPMYRWSGSVDGWATRTYMLPPGSYPVRGYITQGTEIILDEVIATLTITDVSDSHFSYSNSYIDIYPDPTSGWMRMDYGVTITNMGAATRTANMVWWKYYGGPWALWHARDIFTITLAPGESYNFKVNFDRTTTNDHIKVYVIDDLGGKSPVKTAHT